ncbi:hypothetical protein [Melittangium boletus]|uniref:Lipoprotein n=1 Tax=Melittangium boletus DSM 14713 TaxID=1294270 RepID=A0A250I899_9BACT|nr:hypothetical protein [Melittangium boletus]ATB27428.1 hypothetical protein MEBOL_000870 [Melittangium boletus DSM 14713]
MKLHAVCCVLVLSGCATATSPGASVGASVAQGARSHEEILPEPVRLESTAGTFLVHPNNARDFSRLLAGEPTQNQYISISDVP